MKKLFMSLSACTLIFAAPVAVPTAASAESNRPIVELCKDFIAANPGVYANLGECVSTPARFCNEVKKAGFLELFGFKNQGECVNYIKFLNS
ncbi:MAG: hypothetical protein ABIS38_03610 [Sphingomicrobium sp.]